MIAHYQSPEGRFFNTSDDHEKLITRPRDLQDNATPSSNATPVTTLLKLAGFTNEMRYVALAHQALAQMQPMPCLTDGSQVDNHWDVVLYWLTKQS